MATVPVEQMVNVFMEFNKQYPHQHNSYEPDLALAARLMLDAEQGDIDAQFRLAVRLEVGLGVKRDLTQAIRWYRAAAEAGLAAAQYKLSSIYANMRSHHAESSILMHRAGESGFSPAQYSLGDMYSQKPPVGTNHIESFEWFMKAARQGHVDAQLRVAQCYYLGKGVEQDYSKAYVWFLISSSNGYPAHKYITDLLRIWPHRIELDVVESLMQSLSELIKGRH